MKNEERPLDVFAGLEIPAPPSDLRARSVVAARSAMAESTAPAGLWSRLWYHRGLRLAWAGSVGALLIAHAAVSPNPSEVVSENLAQPAFLSAATVNDVELAEIVDLPRVGADTYLGIDS